MKNKILLVLILISADISATEKENIKDIDVVTIDGSSTVGTHAPNN